MKIQFLGTGAADWRSHSDNGFFRRFSSVLINDELLIDPGPHIPDAIKQFNIELTKIKFIINTHKHSDHFSESTISFLSNQGIEYYDLSSREDYKVQNYLIHSYPANHSTAVNPKHFLIENNGDKLYYALDGAWLMYDEIQAIIKFNPINGIILDCTVGNVKGDYRVFEHNNINMVLEIKNSLIKYCNNFIISHMAKTLHQSHDELSSQMNDHGIITAYDGLILNI